MPDITMCKGTGCKHATHCYRATATPSERQSWAMFHEAARDEGGNCAYFWPNTSASAKADATDADSF